MGKGSYNGGGKFWGPLDFGPLPIEGQPDPKQPSQYAHEIMEIRFNQMLPAHLSRRLLELTDLAKLDQSKLPEIQRLQLWLSDLETYRSEAAEYVRAASVTTDRK